MGRHAKTKRSLAPSVLMIVMCLTLLIGATYAWFTDTASTSVNKVQAGTLDVALLMLTKTTDSSGNATETWESAEEKTLNFADVNGNTDIKWEPGCTFTLPKLKIVNNGDLALKYKVVFSLPASNSTEAQTNALKLARVLDVTMNGQAAGTLYDVLTSKDADGYAHGTLAGNAETDPILLSVTMRDDAGNEYQGLAIDGIAITVLATQDTVEYDSYNNTYDKDATYPAYDTAGIADAISALNNSASTTGGTVAIAAGKATLPTNDSTDSTNKADISGDNITISGAGADETELEVPETGYTISGSNVTVTGVTITGAEISDEEKETAANKGERPSTLNLSGDDSTLDGVVVNADGGDGTTYATGVKISKIDSGKTVTIKNSTIKMDGYEALKVQTLNGTLKIENSTLDASGSNGSSRSCLVVGGGSGTLTVTGCTLKNYIRIADFKGASTFTKCTFENGLVYLGSGTTNFVNCEIKGVTLHAKDENRSVTFTNCTYNGIELSTDIVKGLWASWGKKPATVTINGSTVALN